MYRDALQAARLNYEMVEKMQQQGVKSEFELLRAKVEVSNLEPQLTQARNQARIAENVLKDLIEVDLVDSLASEYEFDEQQIHQPLQVPRLVGLARQKRAGLHQQEILREITRRAIGVVDSDNNFKLDFETQYGWQYQADNRYRSEQSLVRKLVRRDRVFLADL